MGGYAGRSERESLGTWGMGGYAGRSERASLGTRGMGGRNLTGARADNFSVVQLWHLTFSSVSRLTLFHSARQRLDAASCIARVLRACVLLFAVVDDHVHVLIECLAAELGVHRSALSRALARTVGVPLAPSHVQPVRSRVHLLRNVRYFLTQPVHHGLGLDPALDPGCCFQDLVGARCLPGFDPWTLSRALPRLTRAELLGILDLPGTSLEPATREDLRRAGVSAIVRASAGAVGVVELVGRSARTVEARRGAVRVCDEAGFSRRDVGEELRMSGAAIRRLAHEPVAPALIRAIRMRVTLASTRARRAAS